MPDRALAAAFGGLGEFMKLRRGYQQETEDREQKQQAFESGMERDRVLTEGGRLQNTETQARINRQPTVDRDTDFDAAIRRMGGIQNLTSDHYTAWAGDDPLRKTQIPGLMKAAAEAGARIKVQDQQAASAGQLTDLQTQAARLELPGKQTDAKNREQATKWVLEHPEANPLEDDFAARMFAMAGQPVAPSYGRQRRDQLALANAGRHDYGGALRAAQALEDERLAATLPPGVEAKAGKVFTVLAAPFVKNIDTSLNNIELMKRDLAGPAKGVPGMEGGDASYAEQQAQNELERLSMALHTEADDIAWQMKKSGISDAGIEWARQQMRHHLTRVPKYWKDPKTGRTMSAATAGRPSGVTTR